MSAVVPESAASLPRATRFLGAGAGWLCLYLSSPGIVSQAGSALGATAGVALWGWFASRPGRWAFRIEWLLACAAWCGICSWAARVHWSTLLFIGPGFGLYFAGTGVLLRRLAASWSLAVAVPAAWLGTEALRAVLMPPFGMKWMRLGTHVHDVGWLAGSARVWGVLGLSYVLAALAGALADLAESSRLPGDLARRRRKVALAAGGLPLAAAAALAAATHAPAVETGPRVLLVQPAIPQARKMSGLSAEGILRENFQLTREGLDQARAGAERAVDLVAWGESMLQLDLVGPGLREAVALGAKSPPWVKRSWTPAALDEMDQLEREVVAEALIRGATGIRPLLPAGTAFVSGAEVWVGRGAAIGRLGAVALWNARGERAGEVGKLQRVPGAETMLGLERFELVRRTIFALANYVPDLVAHAGSRRLEFTDRTGRAWVLGASVCFDNAFDRPFVDPLREGPVDFHLVVSNEAWFQGDQEPDQMLAFTHLAAIETGRSIVRATNSGIGAVVDPRGRDVARLAVGGLEKEVRGTLRADVPVPVQAERGTRTLYVRGWWLWPALGLALPVVLLLAARVRRRGYSAVPPG